MFLIDPESVVRTILYYPLVPPAGSCGTAKERTQNPDRDTKVLDWFMVLKSCPK